MPQVRDVLTDVNMWLGMAVGMILSIGTILAAGRDVLRAPETAEAAQETASEAKRIAVQNRDWVQQFRVVFCTKEDWLSRQGRAALQCWQVTGGSSEGR